MSKIIEAEIPSHALSAKYLEEGAFVDCYYIEIPEEITLDKYIEAFYTTPLFKVERTILSIATFKSATDRDAAELSLGKSSSYSIWTVESRKSNQVLLCDFTRKTRSWLMVKTSKNEDSVISRLFFGSVVVPSKVSESGHASFGLLFHLFSRFHLSYSKALLNAAYKKLLRKNKHIKNIKNA